MKSYTRRMSGSISLACLLAMGQADQHVSAQQIEAPPESADVQLEGGAEVLTRGPVHEAFAEPFTVSIEEPLRVDREPPEPIDEVPPGVMPEGDDVEWIPGYWGWDDERRDFIWVSGLWRNIPPGQRWVPGSWAQVANGYQWTSGFWTSADTTDIVYLPDPPASQEEGPNTAAPDDDHFWVPGSWQYANNDYAWQPGYWAPAYEDWTWVPARYVWSPYGSIYCAGFWDYNPFSRGVLFSPVYFPNYVYPQFVPQTVVSIGPLMINLFVRPQYGHYYFGNYYGSNFAQVGIVPWLGVGQFGYYRYDPLLSFYQTGYFNGDGGFLGRVSGWHQFYLNNPNARPAMTFADMQAARANGNLDPNVIRQASMTQSLDEFRRSSDRHFEMHEVAASQRERFQNRNKEFRDLQQQRRHMRLDGDQRNREQARLRLPPTEERPRQVEALPARPDQDRDNRRSTRPDQLDDGRTIGRYRPTETPDRDASPAQPPDRGATPDDRPNRERRNPVEAQPQPRERGTPDQRQRGSQERERRGRNRPKIAYPDVPGNQGQEPGQQIQKIPRPSEQPRSERRQNPPQNREQGRERKVQRPDLERGGRGPSAQPTPNPVPPEGNRGNVNPPGGNRAPEVPRGNPGGNRNPQPQGNPNAGRGQGGGKRQPGNATGGARGPNPGGNREGSGKRDDRRPQ
jgi:hypothetical protein